MATIASISTQSSTAPSGMTQEEWAARCDLAAAYRLAALYGWTDLNNTHFSLRVPGTENHFLINPFGMFFDEITASSLIKVDDKGNVLGDSDYPINPAGFVIHGAVHMSSPDLHCVIHTHSRFGAAVAMQKQGLLPASQKALTVMGWVGYHDFEGPAVDASEQPRIVSDLSDNRILILRNHCRLQIDALSGGSELQSLSEETQNKSVQMGLKMYAKGGFIEVGREWPALLRQLERAGMDDYAR
jgi:ribulose-5-phosphate 4-epimerase/fuculose-1-phosphate aldolase